MTLRDFVERCRACRHHQEPDMCDAYVGIRAIVNDACRPITPPTSGVRAGYAEAMYCTDGVCPFYLRRAEPLRRRLLRGLGILP